MRLFMMVIILMMGILPTGCGNTNDEPTVDYDNPNLTGGLIYTPDRLVVSDNATSSLAFSFTYNKELMVIVGVDTTLLDSIYDVSFDVNSCLTAISFGGVCTIGVKFKETVTTCTDTADKFMVLNFRYLHDFGQGYVKTQLLPVKCASN